MGPNQVELDMGPYQVELDLAQSKTGQALNVELSYLVLRSRKQTNVSLGKA